MSETTLQKKTIRDSVTERLSRIDFFSLIQKSAKLAENFQFFCEESKELLAQRYVVSFYPFETEPQINIEKEDRSEGYRVAYVRIAQWSTRLMEAREARRDLPGQWEELELKNGNKIFQPTVTQPQCKSEEVAVILVPGVAFSKSGHRLGRGAGFYDRFLAKYPHALRMGIAFSEQMVGEIPLDSWDENLDMLLTDEGVFYSKPFGQWKIYGKIESRS